MEPMRRLKSGIFVAAMSSLWACSPKQEDLRQKLPRSESLSPDEAAPEAAPESIPSRELPQLQTAPASVSQAPLERVQGSNPKAKNSDDRTNEPTEAKTEAPSPLPQGILGKGAAPSVPVIVMPGSNLVSHGPQLQIVGNCASGIVILSGDISKDEMLIPGGQLETDCIDGNFSFTLRKSQAGSYTFEVRAQNVLSGVQSAGARLYWTLDDAAPLDPVLTLPRSSPFSSGSGVLDIAGTCENGARVNLSGAVDAQTICEGGTFRLRVSKTQDGLYDFYIQQTDLSGNSSGVVSLRWQRDSTLPPAPQLLSPGPSVLQSESWLEIKGRCLDGMLVSLRGDVAPSDIDGGRGALDEPCSASQFEFKVGKSQDGIYHLELLQTNPSNGFSSEAVNLTWTLDTQVPAPVEVTSPASLSLVSGGQDLRIDLSCERGAWVSVSGDANERQRCDSGSLSFLVNASSDETYRYQIRQTDKVGLVSPAVQLTWTRDTTRPALPQLSQPEQNFTLSDQDTLDVSGSCVGDQLIVLSGDLRADEVLQPSAALEQTCRDGKFYFKLQKLQDDTYAFNVEQVSAVNAKRSGLLAFTWTRDTQTPLAPSIAAPAADPFSSGDLSVTLSGGCETGASVQLTGASSQEVICQSEKFSFNLQKSTDNIYNFELTQTDAIGHRSIAKRWQWIRDSSIPDTPTLLSPGQSPYTAAARRLILEGTCTDQYVVSISGDISRDEIISPENRSSLVCVKGTFQFVLEKSSDGIFELDLIQSRDYQSESAPLHLTWVRDSVAPSALQITEPHLPYASGPGPLRLAGSCEVGARVILHDELPLTKECVDGLFSFVIDKPIDGTYDVQLAQVDAAGNSSPRYEQRWVRDASAAAVEASRLLTPKGAVTINADTQLTLSGICPPGGTVQLIGPVQKKDVLDPKETLKQTCPATGRFRYILSNKDDGQTRLTVKVSKGAGEPVQLEILWIRDSRPPLIARLEGPGAVNQGMETEISFNADEAEVTYECRIKSGTFFPCSSPYSLKDLSLDETYSFGVRAQDKAGNRGPERMITWQQKVFRTIALYHFDPAAPLLDSSLWPVSEKSTLTEGLTAATLSSGWAGKATSFDGRRGLMAADQSTYRLTEKTMTVEAFLHLDAMPGPHSRTSLISKSGQEGDYGWRIELHRREKDFQLVFLGSLDGKTFTKTRSRNFPMSTQGFQHLAVTWDHGTVKFYLNGRAIGHGKKGKSGRAALYSSRTPLRLGIDAQAGKGLIGSLDEVRISQIVRWPRSFVPPLKPYDAD